MTNIQKNNIGAAQQRHELETPLHHTPSEVYEFIGQHLHRIIALSMRHYVESTELKKAGLDWKQALLETWEVDHRIRVLIQLTEDSQLTSSERVEIFQRETGASLRTYFYLQSQIRKVRAGNHYTRTPAPSQFCRNQISATTLETKNQTDQTEVVKVRNP